MTQSLPDFTAAQVLVIGDVILDRYWHGATSRISPEAPVPVVHVDGREERPGGAGNVAVNIAALGAHVTLLGLTGEDDSASVLQSLLAQQRIHHHLERIPDVATITKLRVISRHQQLIRLDFEDGFAPIQSQSLLPAYYTALRRKPVVILSDYGKGTLQAPRQLITLGREAGVPVLIDPKGSDFSRYCGASIITPNLTELEAVVGPCTDLTTLAEKGERLRQKLELEALLITRGEQGMTLLQKARAPFHLPAEAREVFDVTGAGDTVIAVLGAALAAGSSVKEAMRLANLAAGIVVGKLGTASVTRDELQQGLHPNIPRRDILSTSDLLPLVNLAKRCGERIVMTNGCFDILHPGHVKYLAEARELGDRLIVAVNDDASVRRLKGTTRPITPLPQRMAVLAALRAVDWVVPFSEDTPLQLIQQVLPDVLVKGGDYAPEQVAGADTVMANGGEVVILGYQEGYSTSHIIEAIRNSEGDLLQ